MMADLENFDPDFQPPKKRAKVATSRFKSPRSDEEMASLTKGVVPANTQRQNVWSMRVFREWKAERNERCDDGAESCPDDLLDNPNCEKLNYWLSRFVAETRKRDGKQYPPATIHQILAGLQRHILEKHPMVPKILDRSQAVFRDLHQTCDSVYRSLHQEGIGTAVRHAAIFTADEEDRLWSTGAIGCTTPKNLQRAVFFYVGKRFCIRGGDEQRKLGPSQFVRSHDPDCFTYIEHGSKNRAGGIAQLRLENKCVPCYAVPEKNPECLVFLLDFYLGKLPEYAIKEDILYCRPKPKTPADGPWYDAVPVGKNKLSTMVKDMCVEAGLPQRSNHSLRATGATSLFQSNVPEHIIQKTTGHRSTTALRLYERVSAEQQQAVSRVMMAREPTSFQAEMEKSHAVKESAASITASAGTSGDVKRLFGDLTNCTIGNLTVNIRP